MHRTPRARLRAPRGVCRPVDEVHLRFEGYEAGWAFPRWSVGTRWGWSMGTRNEMGRSVGTSGVSGVGYGIETSLLVGIAEGGLAQD